MKSIHILKNPIQKYAWGSRTAIAELTGRPAPAREPEAELWMGAHPKAPSMVRFGKRLESLSDLIAGNPSEILGVQTARDYQDRLPFLFKVLAAGEALSIQAHPNLKQARAGYARENEQGLSPDASDRNYRDDNHKPECICALTPFWGMNGFRPIPDIHEWMSMVCPRTLSSELHELNHQPDEQGLKTFIKNLLEKDEEQVKDLLDEAVRSVSVLKGRDPVYDWMLKLFRAYPGDVGGLFPGILNLVCLDPGQAMFLPAGQFHAYLEGAGIELMANSDNVLRGGLTPKHVDVPELLRVLVFEQGPVDILTPVEVRRYERVYQTPAREFALSVIELAEEETYRSSRNRRVEILLVAEGEVSITGGSAESPLGLTRGMSVVVPVVADAYEIRGQGTLYKAAVPGSIDQDSTDRQ